MCLLDVLRIIVYTFGDFQQGEISMEVMFVAPDEDSDDENNEYEDEHGFRSATCLTFYLFSAFRGYRLLF